MTGKNQRVKRRTAATPASDRGLKAYIYKSQDENQYPVITTERIDEETARKVVKLSEHKGNVLLDDVQPGQRVFLNATSIVGQPFIFEPLVTDLQEYMHDTSAETATSVLVPVYMKFRDKLEAAVPKLHSIIADQTRTHELLTFMRDCELVVGLRQLCFDVPIPLLDMDSVKNGTHDTTGQPSNTKARKMISKPATSGSNKGDASGSGSKVKERKAKDDTPGGANGAFTIPCMMSKGKEKMIFACFPDALRDADRVSLPLQSILKVQGVVVSSEPFLMKTVDNFKQIVDNLKQRGSTDKSPLQQEYREAFQACIQFINREGTTRSEVEWQQFITNCVHIHALRHVLYGKPLHARSPGQDSAADQSMDQLLQMLDAMVLSSGNKQGEYLKEPPAGLDPGVRYERAPGGEVGFSFEDIDKVKEITVITATLDDVPQTVLTSGAHLKVLLDRAEELCQKDTAIAKQLYTRLAKKCEKTLPEMLQLRDQASIGIPQAVKEATSWAEDSLYLSVLGRVLHDIPLKAIPGRGGMPKGGGVLVGGALRMHG